MRGKTGQGCVRGRKTSVAADAVGAGAGRIATQVADLERTVSQISLNAKRGSEQYSLRTLQQRDDMRVEYLGTRDCSRLQLSRVRDHLRETRTGSLAVSRVARKAGRLPALRSCIRCCDRCSVAPAVLPCSDLDQIAVECAEKPISVSSPARRHYRPRIDPRTRVRSASLQAVPASTGSRLQVPRHF